MLKNDDSAHRTTIRPSCTFLHAGGANCCTKSRLLLVTALHTTIRPFSLFVQEGRIVVRRVGFYQSLLFIQQFAPSENWLYLKQPFQSKKFQKKLLQFLCPYNNSPLLHKELNLQKLKEAGNLRLCFLPRVIQNYSKPFGFFTTCGKSQKICRTLRNLQRLFKIIQKYSGRFRIFYNLWQVSENFQDSFRDLFELIQNHSELSRMFYNLWQVSENIQDTQEATDTF